MTPPSSTDIVPFDPFAAAKAISFGRVGCAGSASSPTEINCRTDHWRLQSLPKGSTRLPRKGFHIGAKVAGKGEFRRGSRTRRLVDTLGQTGSLKNTLDPFLLPDLWQHVSSAGRVQGVLLHADFQHGSGSSRPILLTQPSHPHSPPTPGFPASSTLWRWASVAGTDRVIQALAAA